MAKETLKYVQDLLDEQAPTDNTALFEELWGILCSLKDRIDARFELTVDASSNPVHDYSGAEGGPVGQLITYTGPEIDWLVHSHLANPSLGFTNMHLTVWLGAQTKVPHLGMAWGTIPDTWFYLDYIPRADLWVDLDHLDRYYTPRNEAWLELRERITHPVFTSRDLFIREALSQTNLCYSGPSNPEMTALLRELATAHVDQWLAWVDAGDPVPEAERAALSVRDEAVRRNIAVRDPANVMGVRYFGEEMTERLVGTLWGAGRANPRAGL